MADTTPQTTGPWNGAIGGAGIGAILRIPLPGSDRLAIELSPRNYKGRSTSTLFIQDIEGRRLLRLDYGFNVKTGMIEYHWNQKGVYDTFKIANHSPAGTGGAALYKFAKGFKYLGRTLVVLGVAMDAISIVQSTQPLRRSVQVASAWAGAAAGAESAGAVGAAIGTAIEPGGGTAVLGLIFAIAGGAAGYWGGERAGTEVYDWGAAHFHALPAAAVGNTP